MGKKKRTKRIVKFNRRALTKNKTIILGGKATYAQKFCNINALICYNH